MSGTFQPLIPFLALGFESTEERERELERERESSLILKRAFSIRNGKLLIIWEIRVALTI